MHKYNEDCSEYRKLDNCPPRTISQVVPDTSDSSSLMFALKTFSPHSGRHGLVLSNSLKSRHAYNLCSNCPCILKQLKVRSNKLARAGSRGGGRDQQYTSMAMAMATGSGSSSRSAGSSLTAVALAWTLLCFVTTGTVAAIRAPIGAPSPSPSLAPGPGAPSGSTQPENFAYYQIWADQEGETHFTKCKMQGFNLTIYSSLPQFVRSDFGGEPKLMVLTELAVGLAQPLHPAPQVQFVVTLSGSWYIETTDGTRHEFVKGDLLFQDDILTSPADKTPEHYSGTVGDEPCQQLVVQLTRPPQVDNVCPF